MPDTKRSPETTPIREPLAFDARARRVLELRKQVREGTYRPDAGDIARALVDQWLAVGDVVLRDLPIRSVDTPLERREVAGRFVVEPTADAAATRTVTRSA